MTYLVQADIEALRSVARNLRSFSEQLHAQQTQLSAHVDQFVSGLFYSQAQQMLEATWDQLQPERSAIVDQATGIAQRLELFAQRLEAADASYGSGGAAMLDHLWRVIAGSLGSLTPAILAQALSGPGKQVSLSTGAATTTVFNLLVDKYGESRVHKFLGSTTLKSKGALAALGIGADLVGALIDGEEIDGAAITASVAINGASAAIPLVGEVLLVNDTVQLVGNVAIDGSEWLLEHTALSDEMRQEVDQAANAFQQDFQNLDISNVAENGVGWLYNVATNHDTSKNKAAFTNFFSSAAHMPESAFDYVAAGEMTLIARAATLVPGADTEAINAAATAVIKEFTDKPLLETLGSAAEGAANLAQSGLSAAGSWAMGGVNMVRGWL